jgi:(R,R)-butanediol dehydrogenase / meso-butanediol dehydrogenase / diacetyl reductase
MKAARFYGKQDIRVEDVPEPQEPAGRQVLIEVDWCGICGSDLHEYRAGPIQVPVKPHPLTGAVLPQILGHEFAGRVIASGTDAAVAVGSEVAVMPLVACGTCASCRRGLSQLCAKRGAVGMSHPWGGLARYALVDRANVVLLPPGFTTEAGALLEPAAVAATAVRRAQIEPGSAVLITGAGPIGALVALAALAAGAGPVLVSEPSRERAAFVAQLGDVQVVDPTRGDVVEAVARIVDCDGPAVALECVGNAVALGACIDAVRPGGTVVLCGLHSRLPEVDITACVEKQLSLLGSYCYDTKDWSDVIDLIASGSLPVRQVVTGRISLDDVVIDGFQRLLEPSTGDVKILVRTS